MPDYIGLFSDMVERGHDMTDMPWSDWQTIASTMLFEFDIENLDGVTIQ